MNVTAFIRKTSAKDKATIYFRVRDEKCDIKCASELTINPNHWDAKRQSYKQRIALVKDSERQQLNDAILDLKRLISKEYYIGATAEWLKRVIFLQVERQPMPRDKVVGACGAIHSGKRL